MKKGKVKRKGKFDFNRKHPELKKGEIFYTNTFPGETVMSMRLVRSGPEKNTFAGDMERHYTGTWDDFKGLKFRTKRLGKVAYDSEGSIIEGERPVFIKITEALEQRYNTAEFFADYSWRLKSVKMKLLWRDKKRPAKPVKTLKFISEDNDEDLFF